MDKNSVVSIIDNFISELKALPAQELNELFDEIYFPFL